MIEYDIAISTLTLAGFYIGMIFFNAQSNHESDVPAQ